MNNKKYQDESLANLKKDFSVLNNIPKPILLDDQSLPAMPNDIITGWLGDIIEAIMQYTETPRELPTLMALAAISTCCQKKFTVSPELGYQEPINIWSLPVLESANRKSSVIKILTQPLIDWEYKQAKKLTPEIKKLISRRKTAEKKIELLRKQAVQSKGLDYDDLQNKIENLESNLPTIPIIPRLWAQDITPENLGIKMAENGGKIAILSAEGGIFDIMAGRYSNNMPNIDIFLQSHAGDAIRVDRNSREPLFIDNPTLTIGLSPQPSVLRSLATKKEFRGRGLLARFLYAIPQSNLGNRKLNNLPIPEKVEKQYKEKINWLIDFKCIKNAEGQEQPFILQFNTAAYKEWKDFQKMIEQELKDSGQFGHIKDWAGKLPGAAARLAGLLHCANHAGDNNAILHPISLATTKQALSLAAILVKHALAAFDLIGSNPDLEKACKIWHWIENKRNKTFTARDCFNDLRGSFKKMIEVNCAIHILQERYYVFLQSQKNTGKKGRPPSHSYLVNPHLTNDWQ